jgi:uncharacterized membrane protein YccC
MPDRIYPWWHAPRVAVAMAVPLCCRLVLPHGELWAVLPFGVLPVALTDRGGSRLARAERCLVGLSAAAIGALLGGAVAGHPWPAAIALTAVAALSGAISWLGPLASVAALDLLVFASIGSGGSLGPPFWRPPLLILAGGVWTLVLLLGGRVASDTSWRHDPPDGRRMVAAAVRLASCMAVAEAVGNLVGVERAYWIAVTVAIVLRPELGHVLVRSLARGAGTVVGAAAGAGLLAAVGPHWGAVPVAALLAAVLPLAVRRHYALFAAGISALVVVLVAPIVGHPERIAVDRIVDTLIGCGIVLTLGYAVWLWLARTILRRAPT